ncbi:MAG: 3-oxoacyl-[acyl-carrier-protein] reductase FabG [Pseudomonadota bacterium]
MELKGKAAIVTGSSSGVGRATALRLARKGCSVLINYSSKRAEAEKVSEEVKALGVQSVVVQADVANDADCRKLADTAVKTFGRLDVLVNNAGTTRFIDWNDLDAVQTEDWDRIFGVNVRGAFQCARAARKALEASGHGAIVNVSSTASLRPFGSSIPYCASKGALNNLTLTLARTLAPKIRVNAVAPGFIAGDWLQAGLGAAYEIAKKHAESKNPLQRVSEPDDIAAAILALIEGGDMVTGHILPVEGGVLFTQG